MIRGERTPMKGQMFMIGSVIVVVFLILIRTSTDVSQILEKKKFLEAGVEKAEFDNIRSEIPKSAFNMINNTRVVGSSFQVVNESIYFINFTEDKVESRNIQFDGVTVGAWYLGLGSPVRVNFSFHNFFETNVSTLILNITNMPPQSINDTRPGQTVDTSITQGGSPPGGNETLWIYYRTPTESVTYSMPIELEAGTTKYFGYFDLRTATDRGDIRDRFTETVEIS